MKRNTMFTGLSLMVAGAAIGAGAMVSSNAMADSAGPIPTEQLTMVSVGPDGDAIQCTFEGADVKGLLPDLPAGMPSDGSAVAGSLVVGSGEIQPADGSLPEVLIAGSAQLPAGGTDIAVAAGGELPTGAPVGAPMRAFNVDDAREGTPDECAALHDQTLDMASQIAAGGGQLVSTSGTVTGGSSVATQP